MAPPGATQDLDLVIAPDAPRLAALVRRLIGSGFYVDQETALEALRGEGQFNAIEPIVVHARRMTRTGSSLRA